MPNGARDIDPRKNKRVNAIGLRRLLNFRLEKGSLTVEAALAMPVFIIVVFTLMYFIKIVYVHSIMQTALVQVGREISTYSYIYKVSGLQAIHDDINDNLDNYSQEFSSRIDAVTGMYGILEEAGESLGNQDQNIDDIIDYAQRTTDQAGDLYDMLLTVAQDPIGEVKVMLGFIANGLFEKGKSYILSPAAKLMLKKHLTNKSCPDLDTRLKSMDIRGGEKGLSFSESLFFEDGDSIELNLEYEVDPVIPVELLPRIRMKHRVYIYGWLDGQGAITEEENANLWALDPRDRGMKIEKEEGKRYPGKNTSAYFKTVDHYDLGPPAKIYLFCTMNPTLKSYQTESQVKASLKSRYKQLSEFEYAERDGIVLDTRTMEDVERIMVLILPEEVSLSEDFEKAWRKSVKEAEKLGVKLISRNGYGKLPEEE